MPSLEESPRKLQRARTVSRSTAADASSSDSDGTLLSARRIAKQTCAPGADSADEKNRGGWHGVVLDTEYPAGLTVRNTFLEFRLDLLEEDQQSDDRLEYSSPRFIRRLVKSAPCSPLARPTEICEPGVFALGTEPLAPEAAGTSPDTAQDCTILELSRFLSGAVHDVPAELPAHQAQEAMWSADQQAGTGYQQLHDPFGRLAQLGSAQVPTMGSVGHGLGNCKPCAFAWKAPGCGNGMDCPFCHICGPGEKKRRSKDKRAQFKAAELTR
jgi:hypothetical protein